MGIWIALAGCAGSSASGGCTGASTVMASATVFPAEPYLLPGETKPLAAEVKNACGFVVSGAGMAWTSSNPGVVKVNEAGNLTGVSIGLAQVIGRITSGPDARGLTADEAGISVRAQVRVVSSRGGDPKDLLIFPSNPVAVAGVPVQLTAVPVDEFGHMVPGTTINWTSDDSFVASIIGDGLVAPALPGRVGITAHLSNAGTSPVSLKTTQLTIQAINGAAPPPPDVAILPSSLTMYVGQTRTVEAKVTDANTGEPVPATVSWQMSVAGVVSLTPLLPSQEQVNVDALAGGTVELIATAVTNLGTVVSAPATIEVLPFEALIPGTWTRLANLPIRLSHHEMSAINGHLYVTGGVSNSFLHGGPVEDVFRATLRPDGLISDPASPEPLINSWWEHSYHYRDTDPKIRNFGACPPDWWPTDPSPPPYLPCMYIWREAHGAVFAQYVHYQVFDHAQAVWDAGTHQHIYVVAGVDAQVDMGVQPDDPNAVGPDQTRFSERLLMADVSPDGGIPDWRENPAWTLPSEGIVGPNLIDVPGRAGASLAVHGNRLYLTGGWGWTQNIITLAFSGRNRDTVWFTELDPITGEPSGWTETTPMPEALNRHASAVVGDWLIVSGGVGGVDETVADQVRSEFYLGKINQYGHIDRWNPGRNLPKPLSRHVMLTVPGTNYLLVAGGDDLYSASAEVYLTNVNPLTGAMGGWRLLPVIPVEPAGTPNLGRTGFAATMVMGDNNGTPVARLYLSGGGYVSSGGPATYEIKRNERVWMLEFTPP